MNRNFGLLGVHVQDASDVRPHGLAANDDQPQRWPWPLFWTGVVVAFVGAWVIL